VQADEPVTAPIGRGWISTGGTGAQNYDEFADDAEITAIVAANPDSALAVEMPHRTPDAVAAGWSFDASLDAAVTTQDRLRANGRFREAADVVAPYRVDTPTGPAYGLFCTVRTTEISSAADEPGRVVRNEEVFVAKVAQRTALLRRLRTSVSPVLLLQTGSGDALHAALAEVIERLGAPAVTDVDQHGQQHAVWLVDAGTDQQRLLTLAGDGELVVADGNHRSLAAQRAGLSQFLAVVTTPASVRIAPYDRLLADVDVPLDVLAGRLAAAGALVQPVDGPPTVPPRGTVLLHTADRTLAVDLGQVDHPTGAGSVAERLDHAVVERLLIGNALGLDPGDPRITYVGGDYGPAWLAAEVAAGRAWLAVLIAPVSVEDFIAVNLARATMPRKSTWFTPKARTGLVLAEVEPGVDPAAG